MILAELREYQGRYAEAEPLFKRSLAIQERALGPDHPEVATVLNNLGVLYLSQGKSAEAEPLHKRALEIREKALGPDHPEVASSLSNLAVLCGIEGRYAEAEPFFKRSLAIREKDLGPDHPSVATSLSNLAALYFNLGRYAEAEALHSRALSIREKALGPRSREALESVRGLAWCELKEGKLKDARERSAYGVGIAREMVARAPNDRRASFAFGSFLLLKGRIEAAMGKGREAQSSWKEALSILQPAVQQAQGLSDQDTYVQVLLCLGRTEEAGPIVRKLLDSGYKNADLLALCREKGLAPKE